MKKVLIKITKIEERTKRDGRDKYFHITGKTDEDLRVGLNLNANMDNLEVVEKLSQEEKIELNIEESEITKAKTENWTGERVSAKVKDNYEYLKKFGFKSETPFQRFVNSLENK